MANAFSNMTDTLRFNNEGFALVQSVLEAACIDGLCRNLDGLRSSNSSYAGIRNLLDQSPAVRKLAACRELRELVEPILGPDAFCTRALLFDKSVAANWWVGWHQDQFITVRERREVPGYRGFWRKEGVLHVIPPVDVLAGMLTLRVHLDDSPADNGPLQVMPGSHRWGLLSEESLVERSREPHVVTCAVSRGGVLLMRPLLLHASPKAIRPARRRVIHLEYAAADLPGGLEWHKRVQ